MAKNDFKPFAIGEYANVLTQEQYEALPAVGAGYTAGIAKSEQLNKTWRQASVMSAVLGNFIADQSGDDVLDDGDLENLKLSLEKAIHKFLTSSSVDDRYFLKAGGEVGKFGVISSGDIVAKGSNLIAKNGAIVIKNSDDVNLVVINADSNGVLTLNPVVGSRVVNTTGELREAGERVYSPNNPQPISFPVTSVNGKSGDVNTASANFNAGWHKDEATGLITQWGRFTSTSSNIETQTYPIPFTNRAFTVSGNLGTSVNTGNSVYLEPKDNASFTSKVSGSSMGVNWLAIGY
ncbi:hypothetical protein KDV93_20675 [Serratia ureilytica]|uniref:gp53-like domain-containing protein n=1 Tax=Serratia ureilytica TaxID=300181 RepID=UPI00332A091C